MSTLPFSKPKAVTTSVITQTRALLTPLNLHFAGVGLLGLVNVYLLLHMLFAWTAASSRDADALVKQGVALKTAQIAGRPLQGLDVKLAEARANADEFSRRRLPVSYSEVAAELGALAKADHVRLTRVQYAQAPVLGDAAGALTEVQMDASLSGDYRPLALFINGLERDRTFFLISAVALTGGQAGTVNLRLRLTTYLRGAGSEEEMKKVTFGAEPQPETGVKPVAGGAQ